MENANTAPNEENTANNNNNNNRPTSGGLKDFIANTSLIGNVIAAAAHNKSSSEPLPFPNYSLFEENDGKFKAYNKLIGQSKT
jgi:hypothetical protein